MIPARICAAYLSRKQNTECSVGTSRWVQHCSSPALRAEDAIWCLRPGAPVFSLPGVPKQDVEILKRDLLIYAIG
eukprot:CAMPEP_0202078088 /NCGR_PEP_ID=MMETSP0964-20121228/5732_1 /ASSEMBLY_ACC=CAM_ASM_000500 /TAXON_ID=4773 /ORGANISM="Schizochytrium aggregatum, Strain ATCC28209" /LENGTH=74 /DNA_ID=CAMNT_0048645383 /DNA_START=441 /DNA_END=665 /DNA_ORIENTATION=+